MDHWDAARPGQIRPSGSLGSRIAVLRAERGWTQQQLADRIGISRVAVSHLEADMNVPGERTVALLAGSFHMEPHALVEGTTYPRAKADRLPLVATRWTEVEHQLSLLDRDLWWLTRLDGPDEADGPVFRSDAATGAGSGPVPLELVDSWRHRLEELRRGTHDPLERKLVNEALDLLGVFEAKLRGRVRGGSGDTDS